MWAYETFVVWPIMNLYRQGPLALGFGGGTPSLMDPSTTAALIDAARAHWASAYYFQKGFWRKFQGNSKGNLAEI